MARSKRGRLYDVYMRAPSSTVWISRTSGKRETDLEMAQALTRDLQRMGVAWEIRDAADVVVEKSSL